MKSKTLEELEADGWEVSDEDRDRILTQKSRLAHNKALVAIAISMDRIKKSIDNISLSSDSEKIEALLNTHFALINRLIKPPEAEIKSLTFERNKDGLISQALIHRKGVDHR